MNNGELYLWDTTRLTDGSLYRLAISGTDKTGHVSPTITADLSVDNTDPLIFSESPAAGASGPAPAEISAILDDVLSGIDLATLTVAVDGETVSLTDVSQAGSQYTIRYVPGTAPAAGNHAVSVRFADMAGNWVSRSWIFAVE